MNDSTESMRPAFPPPTRRQMLARMGGGFGMLALSGMLGYGERAAAATAGGAAGIVGPHFAARAKRVIFLFMNGAPSHVDTFDPKPALARFEGNQPTGDLYKKPKTTGFMPSPFKFQRYGRAGMEISELLPHVAGCADDLCLIRSMRTDVPNHEPGLLMMNTGNIQPIRPSLGSWVVYGLGRENQELPGFVVLRPGRRIVVGPALWSQGFLPARYQAAEIFTDNIDPEKLLPNLHNGQLSAGEQRRQLDLIQELNREHMAQRDGDAALDAEVRAFETAFRMQSEAMDVLDIRGEPAHVRESYGDSPFANSCLMARRLVEAGVRFVQVYYTVGNNTQPWDTHDHNNQGHTKLCADADRPTAALIADLAQRGLLEDTLVIWGGEFGRTPYSEKRDKEMDASALGRDHHHTAFSMFLAGGGVRGGHVHGASDELGMNVASDPVHVHDLHATILHLLGIDHTRLTYRYSGRDFRLTDVYGKVVGGLLG